MSSPAGEPNSRMSDAFAGFVKPFATKRECDLICGIETGAPWCKASEEHFHPGSAISSPLVCLSVTVIRTTTPQRYARDLCHDPMRGSTRWLNTQGITRGQWW